ncbi:MAG: hypothetical protein ACYC69_03090 [Thermodesulfovibrionales bacterium]
MKDTRATMFSLDNLSTALTSKAQGANHAITQEIVEDWVGNAGSVDRQIAFMSAALSALNTGQYTADKMVEDMLQTGHLDN